MASETITRNDLTAILNSVLPNPADMTPQEVEDFVDSLLTSADALYEDISDKITYNSTWTNLGKFAYRVGKACFFYLEGYAGTVAGGTEYTLASIAEGYRPSVTVVHTGHTTNGNFTAQGVVNVFVKINGNITVRASNSNGNYVFATGWWILP